MARCEPSRGLHGGARALLTGGCLNLLLGVIQVSGAAPNLLLPEAVDDMPVNNSLPARPNRPHRPCTFVLVLFEHKMIT